MHCKGICIRYRAGSNTYASGYKRCRACDLFMKWDGILCPCCKHKLRARPRNPRLNAKLREKKAKSEPREIKVFSHSNRIV